MLEFSLSISYFLLFCLIISKISFFNDSKIPRYWFIVLFGLKIIVSILLTSIYTHYYTDRSTADIFKYFDDSKIMFNALKNNPSDYFKMLFAIDNNNDYFNLNYYQEMSHWIRPYGNEMFSDSHIIIRFNAFVRLFSLGFIQIHNIFINFISLIGLVALYKAFKPFLVKKEKILFYTLALTPSLLFWGSGLLKESLILFGLGLLTLHFFKINQQLKIKSILSIFIGLIILLYTKFYIIAIIVIPFIGYSANKILKRKSILGYLISTSIVFILFYILSAINSEWNLVDQIASKQQTFSRFIAEVKTNSGFIIPKLTNGFSLIKNIPNALNNTIIRPYPWECNSPFVYLNLAENLLVLILIFITFIFRKRNNNYNILYLCFIFSISLLVLIGLTTPVFGAIVRYKIPATLFLLIGLLIIIDTDKLKSKFTFLKKIL